MNNTKFSNTSKIQISDSKKTCRDLVLSDLMCYTCYVCCLSKNQKKPRGKQKRPKNGRNDFFKNKYQVLHIKSLKTRSLHVFLECIVQNYDAYHSSLLSVFGLSATSTNDSYLPLIFGIFGLI